ncbi:5' nucleotidase, NT5C type [Calditerricola satsumensis]|uniref:Uncharacterized protein n=1 Tax=Calditerricola satsumensis TaxID=373054 RepID=A0A8J3BE13_9BACI|nr:5'(3')-deoxyribonucleotidase [Calditerricola satsumensis]GGK07063.1 hypothetical protein GCM10007043_21440 [Calditerricola satsumensis]
MNARVLLIDMDSVIVDLMAEWYARYNRDYGDNLTVARATSWDATTYVKPECGAKIYDYLREPGLFAGLKPLPHAIEVLERLSRRYEIFIVTASPSAIAYAEKEAWVQRHLPFLGRERLIFAHRKEMIRGDLLFDDAPHNLRRFQATGRIAVAMDYPYNRDVACPRVSSWLEFEERLPELLAQRPVPPSCEAVRPGGPANGEHTTGCRASGEGRPAHEQ